MAKTEHDGRIKLTIEQLILILRSSDESKSLEQHLEDIQKADLTSSSIIENLGGYRQMSKLIPLICQRIEAEKSPHVVDATN
jgi:hypothetical protein